MPGRYEDDLDGDSPQAEDGDGFFVGVDSRTEPENLPPGTVSLSENMRFNQRKAVVRAGMEKQTNAISFSGIPLILPFVLDASAILVDLGVDGIFESCVYSDPTTDLEYIMVATRSAGFLFRPGMAVAKINYPANEVILDTDQVDMFQVSGSVYILRGEQSTFTINSISRVGTTATIVFPADHGISTGQIATISGAYPAWYDVTRTSMTAASSSTLTYITGAVTNLADTILETATLTSHLISQAVTMANVPNTYSVYAKPDGRDWLYLALTDSAAGAFNAFFNVTTGAIGNILGATTAAITSAGGGWYRVSITCTPASGLGSVTFGAAAGSGGAGSVTYLGDITKGLFVFAQQLEAHASARDYAPTTAAAVAPNLLLFSEDITNAAWVASNVTKTGNTTAEPATGTIAFNLIKAPLRWDGDTAQPFVMVNIGTISAPYIYMPPSDYGIIMQNRAILQYTRNQSIVSEVLAVEQYNSIFGVFDFRDGEADYVQGFHSYQDNECLVFLRRSIYILDLLNGGVELMTQRELTRQIGLVSRRSIATCGPNVLFLSDNGVYQLQPGLELQLRGNTEPLSAPVDNIIRTINTAAIQKAYGIYFNNRYYLAIPTNGATRNNVMLVYNFLNQQWESKDTFPNGFFCDYMEVINSGVQDSLYLISLEGGIYAYEQLEVDEFGAANQDPTDYLIAGNLVTRRLIYGDTDLKQFLRISANASFDASSGLTVTAITTNPENTKTVSTVTVTTSADKTIRSLINMRAYGLQIQFQNTATRLSVSNYRVNAYTSDRKTITTN